MGWMHTAVPASGWAKSRVAEREKEGNPFSEEEEGMERGVVWRRRDCFWRRRVWSARERPVMVVVRRAGRVVMVMAELALALLAASDEPTGESVRRSMGSVVDGPGLGTSFFRWRRVRRGDRLDIFVRKNWDDNVQDFHLGG